MRIDLIDLRSRGMWEDHLSLEQSLNQIGPKSTPGFVGPSRPLGCDLEGDIRGHTLGVDVLVNHHRLDGDLHGHSPYFGEQFYSNYVIEVGLSTFLCC